MVKVLNPDVCHVALRRPGRAVLMLGDTGSTTSIVLIELGSMLDGADYGVRLYDSEAHVWRSGDFVADKPNCGCSITIEAGGFRILSFEERATRQ
jgi:hypothetical protein